MKMLTAIEVRTIQAEVLTAHDGHTGLRDRELLESALSVPQALGDEGSRDLVGIAAAYLYHLCRNRPFVDGNYRTALLVCLVFLEENGRLPVEQVSGSVWEAFVLDVAEGKLDQEQTSEGLKKLLQEMH
ncbi:MAG: Fic family protein [Chthoniobacterales bacterium]